MGVRVMVMGAGGVLLVEVGDTRCNALPLSEVRLFTAD